MKTTQLLAVVLISPFFCNAQELQKYVSPQVLTLESEGQVYQLQQVLSPPQGGTYWSLQLTNCPPWPANPLPELPVYSWGNAYIFNDLDVDWIAVREQGLSLFGTKTGSKKEQGFAVAMADGAPSPPGEGGGGGEGWTNSSYAAYDYSTNDLWLEIFNGTNDAPITLHNTTQGVRYQLLSRPDVGRPPWLIEQTLFGATGTNTLTTVPFNERPILFFWAGVDSDGDGLIDYLETLNGTDSQTPDTDSDGVNDYIEVVQGRNPTNGAPVSDTTGLVNLQVYTPLR